MNAEPFDDIFTYVGKAPEPTPEEKERIRKYNEEGRIAFKKQWEKMTGEEWIEVTLDEY